VADVMTLQPEAAERLLTHFYATGEVDDSQFAHMPMDFNVKTGFPALAKIALGGTATLLAAIVGAGWFVVRRRRKMKS
ncbi:MAG: hypothetical protein GY803_16650, partial [Chloroflexi bacterium]|nr:hypothetical protein [Chloroflexota bacterium]